MDLSSLASNSNLSLSYQINNDKVTEKIKLQEHQFNLKRMITNMLSMALSLHNYDKGW